MLPITTAQPQGWFGEMTSCPIKIGPQGTTPLPLPVVESSLGVESPGGWKGHSGLMAGSALSGSCALVEVVSYISLQSICSRQTTDRSPSRATISSCSFLSPDQWRQADILLGLSVVVLLLRGLR